MTGCLLAFVVATLWYYDRLDEREREIAQGVREHAAAYADRVEGSLVSCQWTSCDVLVGSRVRRLKCDLTGCAEDRR